MTKNEAQKAYQAIKEKFNLKATQRDQLDSCDQLTIILQAAHGKNWSRVAALLRCYWII